MPTKKLHSLEDPDFKGSPEQWNFLTATEKDDLLAWCERKLERSTRYSHSSYGIKHQYQQDTGNYVYTGAMKAALEKLGYKPDKTRSFNWHYNVKIRD